MKPVSFRVKTLSHFIALSLLALTQTSIAQTQSKVVDLGTVSATTAAGAFREDEASKGTATAVAPVQASLEATEPQSLITRDYISLSVSPIAEYTRIVNIAPSISGDSANGPGLSETKSTLRGFSDDQYNVTFDGIPWGDTNNPAHHSTSFFPAAVVGGASVERGPGNASNLGYATFGGSINMFSKQPAAEGVVNVFGSKGTWNTSLIGVGVESGRIASLDGATAQLNVQRLQSDGYLSNSPVDSKNIAIKFEKPVGDNTLIDVYSTVNKIFYAQPDSNKGATKDQIAAFGRNFQLNKDPASMNFDGFNYTKKDTDFTYLRVRSALSDSWSIDDAVYSYAYDNQTKSSTDPLWTGTTLSLTDYPDPRVTADLNRAKVVGHILGIDKQNQYRTSGAIIRFLEKSALGQLNFGIWYEEAKTDRHQYDLDLTTNTYSRSEKTVNAAILLNTNRPIDSVKFDQQSRIENLQPYVEFAWAATPTTTITPGVKDVSITRSESAQVEQTTRELNHAKSLDYSTTLPYLTINQRLSDSMSVYAQYAKGFQIPDLKTFYIAKPENNSTDPQLSTNYQLGIVSKNDRLIWDLDVYRIEFTNKLVSNNLAGDAAGFVNIGGATYQGVEAQVAYVIGNGFSVSANGSINDATANDTGKQISNAPDKTAALGALYKEGPWSTSLTYKVTGAVHQVDEVCSPTCNDAYYEFYKTGSYSTLDLGIAYTIKDVSITKKPIKIQLNVFNLLDSDNTVSITPGSKTALDDKRDSFIFQAPRSVMLSFNMSF